MRAKNAQTPPHSLLFYSNFSAKLNVFIPAAIEIHGTIGRRYNTLLKGIAEHAYPNLCGWDIDGLRSRCIAAPAARLVRHGPRQPQGPRSLACDFVACRARLAAEAACRSQSLAYL